MLTELPNERPPTLPTGIGGWQPAGDCVACITLLARFKQHVNILRPDLITRLAFIMPLCQFVTLCLGKNLLGACLLWVGNLASTLQAIGWRSKRCLWPQEDDFSSRWVKWHF